MMTPAMSRCCSTRRTGCACKRLRLRSAAQTSGFRDCAGGIPRSSRMGCRYSAVRPARSAFCRSRRWISGRWKSSRVLASALYGMSAIGGVVNLVSRRPPERDQEARVALNRTGHSGHGRRQLAGRAVRRTVGLHVRGRSTLRGAIRSGRRWLDRPAVLPSGRLPGRDFLGRWPRGGRVLIDGGWHGREAERRHDA